MTWILKMLNDYLLGQKKAHDRANQLANGNYKRHPSTFPWYLEKSKDGSYNYVDQQGKGISDDTSSWTPKQKNFAAGYDNILNKLGQYRAMIENKLGEYRSMIEDDEKEENMEDDDGDDDDYDNDDDDDDEDDYDKDDEDDDDDDDDEINS